MKLAYIDSAAWIARFEGLPSYQTLINGCLNELSNKGWKFCASEAVLLEVMAKPYRDNNTSVIKAYNEVFEKTLILKAFPNVFEIAFMIDQGENLKAMDAILKAFPNVFEIAFMIAQDENLKTMDAIHVAIAVQHGCKRFVSTDTHFKNLKIMPVTWIDLSAK